MTFTLKELAECAERELKYRLQVYPRRVASQNMTQQLADRQIGLMRAIAAHFRDEDAKATPASQGRLV